MKVVKRYVGRGRTLEFQDYRGDNLMLIYKYGTNVVEEKDIFYVRHTTYGSVEIYTSDSVSSYNSDEIYSMSEKGWRERYEEGDMLGTPFSIGIVKK